MAKTKKAAASSRKKAPAKTKGKSTPKLGNPQVSADKIKVLAADLEMEMQKFSEGVKAAGKRARKALQEIRKLAAQARKEIQEVINAAKG